MIKTKQAQPAPTKVRLVLTEAMRAKGWGNVELAEKSGLSYQTILALNSDPKAVRMETLFKVCRALDVQPGHILELA